MMKEYVTSNDDEAVEKPSNTNVNEINRNTVLEEQTELVAEPRKMMKECATSSNDEAVKKPPNTNVNEINRNAVLEDQTELVAEPRKMMKECATSSNDEAVKKPPNTNANEINRNAVLEDQMEHVKVYKTLGNSKFIKRDFEGAINFFTQAMTVCPESEKLLLSILYHNRATAYSNLNNNECCIADCTKSLELVPTYTKSLSRRSRAHSEMGNLNKALEDITAAIMLNDYNNQSDAIFAQNIIKCLGQNNLEEYMKHNAFNLPSKTFIENYLKSFSNDLFNDEFSQSLMKSDVNMGLELALKCLRDKDYERIEDACKDELNKSFNSLIRRSLALNLLATFTILRGNNNIGIEYFTTIIETPGVSDKLVINSLIKRGIVYYREEQLEKSYEDFKRAEKINPNCCEIFHHKAQIYLMENNIIKAIEEYKKAIELNPTFIYSNIECCYTQFIHAQNDIDAETNLKKLEEYVCTYYNCAESHTLYAQALSVKGLFEEADFLFKKASEMFPENSTIIVHRAAIAFSWTNSKNNPFDLLEQALKVDPKCEFAYETIVSLYLKTGKLREALEYLEKAILLSKSKKELLRIFSMRNRTKAQLEVVERLGLSI